MIDGAELNWSKGLLPAIVQDANDGMVLMLGFMNREALERTLELGQVTFYSRSRERLWTKGESSGHYLRMQGWDWDCDRDSLLFQAIPEGPTCHLQRKSCFSNAPGQFLMELDQLIEKRSRDLPSGSYTTLLFQSGSKRIAQKVGEEGIELALAAVDTDDTAFLGEAADLMYHTLVLLRSRGFSMKDVNQVLAARHAQRTPSPISRATISPNEDGDIHGV